MIKKKIQEYFEKNKKLSKKINRTIYRGLQYEAIGQFCQIKMAKNSKNECSGRIEDSEKNEYLLFFPKNDTVIYEHFVSNGSWDEESILKIIESVDKEKKYILLDVGANIGLFSIQLELALRSTVKGELLEQIIAFEPVLLLGELARANFSATKIKKSLVLNAAIGSKREERIIYLDAGNAGNNSLLASQVSEKLSGKNNVFVDTLAATLEQHEINLTDKNIILKIDVQGFESEVISGLSEDIIDKIKILLCEITPNALVDESSSKVQKMFEVLKRFKKFEIFYDNKGVTRESSKEVSFEEIKVMSLDRNMDYFNIFATK